ncbi:MAG: tetratricopeptide repeat protein, partial [Alphaproteobacteria bacterium]|nr:tetratricopeptide repeat protein [Alphaproteobacteria bacterium]
SRNDLEGALKNYREGLDISRRLMDADPTHAERARDVSVSVNKIGDVLRSRNDLEGALKNYREGLDIRRRLMDADPTHAERARDVAMSLLRIGNVEVAREAGAAACGYFVEARDIIAALARQAPDVHVYNNDLASLDEQIAQHCG